MADDLADKVTLAVALACDCGNVTPSGCVMIPACCDCRKLSAAAIRVLLEEAAKVANAFPATYQDGVSLHAENMTCARIAAALRSMMPGLKP